MRFLAFALTWLIPLSASAVVNDFPCSEAASDEACFALDFTNEGGTLTAYNDFVQANPGFARALDYQTQFSGLRQAIWDRIAEAEANGGVLDVTNPAAMVATENAFNKDITQIEYFYLPRTEANEVIGAKVAHALWLEVNNVLPWSIAGLTDSEYEDLVDQDRICIDGNGDSMWDQYDVNQSCYFYTFVDHSPSRIYAEAVTRLGGLPYTGTQKQGAVAIMKALSPVLRHGTSGDAKHAIPIDILFTGPTPYAARRGCPSAGRIIAAYLRAVNIPARVVIGYHSGEGHTGVVAQTIDAIMAHGDTVYSANVYPDYAVFDSWTWVNANITPGTPADAVKNSRRDFIQRLWPWAMIYLWDEGFCSIGMSYVQTQFEVDSPQDDHWVTALQTELEARNCPDATCAGCP